MMITDVKMNWIAAIYTSEYELSFIMDVIFLIHVKCNIFIKSSENRSELAAAAFDQTNSEIIDERFMKSGADSSYICFS